MDVNVLTLQAHHIKYNKDIKAKGLTESTKMRKLDKVYTFS